MSYVLNSLLDTMNGSWGTLWRGLQNILLENLELSPCCKPGGRGIES
jgi:hypothetical protein